MARQVRAEIHQADRELRRFVLYQFAEAKKLGYPTMSAFAREIARGTVSVPPPTEEDPLMEAVGEFYFQHLHELERRVIAEKNLAVGTLSQRAKMAGISYGKLQWMINGILKECSGYLKGKGF